MIEIEKTRKASNRLRLKRIGIDTHQEAVVYMRRDCHVCRAEGLASHARVLVSHGAHSVIATLNQITSDFLNHGEASLSEVVWSHLKATEGDEVEIAHPPTLDSLSFVRSKIYGHRFKPEEIGRIIRDISDGHYSDIHLASFLTACSAAGLEADETVALTRAMVDVGERLTWNSTPIVDKHCVGGLPGNRTTPIVVAIVTACGLTMPKTSSRAITSPAGTADVMETLAPIDLDLEAMRAVVEREGGCIAWGGAVRLSPVDEILIRVERALDLDSEGQLVASVLSKKHAAGATHLVLDMPVGPTAKVRSGVAANALKDLLRHTAEALNIKSRILLTDGTQPVGRGIGPALEAHDVLAVLQNDPKAPADLKQRAVAIAAEILELGGIANAGKGTALGHSTLASGLAWEKFQAICEAQGGIRTPGRSEYRHPVVSEHKGALITIDNRRLAMAAKLAGAPDAKTAGIELHCKVGETVSAGEPLFTLHAETLGELEYAIDFIAAHPPIIDVKQALS